MLPLLLPYVDVRKRKHDVRLPAAARAGAAPGAAIASAVPSAAHA